MAVALQVGYIYSPASRCICSMYYWAVFYLRLHHSIYIYILLVLAQTTVHNIMYTYNRVHNFYAYEHVYIM